MNIFNLKEIVAFTWDSENNVFGAQLQKTKDGRVVIKNLAGAKSSGRFFAETLSEFRTKMDFSECDCVIAGGTVESSVCFDINLPAMPLKDIRDAIRYEAPKYLPCNGEDMVYSCRVLHRAKPNDETRMNVRIFAATKKHWNRILGELTASGIKIDAFVYPFMALDPLLSNFRSVRFAGIEKDFVFRLEDTGSRRMISGGRDGSEPDAKDAMNHLGVDAKDFLEGKTGYNFAEYIPVMLIGTYGMSPSFRRDACGLALLPRELKPERYRLLRYSSAALFVLFFCLVFSYGARIWWDARSRYARISAEYENVQSGIADRKKKMSELEKTNALIRKISGVQPGNAEVVQCLDKITAALPKDAWLGGFSVVTGKEESSIEITALFKDDRKSAFSGAGDNEYFRTKSMNKRVNADGTTSFSVKLQYLSPATRKKGDGETGEN